MHISNAHATRNDVAAAVLHSIVCMQCEKSKRGIISSEWNEFIVLLKNEHWTNKI